MRMGAATFSTLALYAKLLDFFKICFSFKLNGLCVSKVALKELSK